MRRRIDRFWMDWTTPGERQQMACQAGPAHESPAHSFEDGLPRLRTYVALQQFQAVRKHRQQIVEVMSDRELKDIGLSRCDVERVTHMVNAQ